MMILEEVAKLEAWTVVIASPCSATGVPLRRGSAATPDPLFSL
jgi:hypothetical protein